MEGYGPKRVIFRLNLKLWGERNWKNSKKQCCLSNDDDGGGGGLNNE
jgi:hypothetical protein